MSSSPIILFDGVCNFCNGTVNFLIRHDRANVFRFAALQSEAGQKLLAQHQLPNADFGTFVLVENGKTYNRSTAALRLVKQLPWYWQWTQVFWIVPRPIRDGVYNIIAKNRYRWFGKKETCMIPTPEMRKRFL